MGRTAWGGTFAPALVESLKRLNYEQFTEIVVNGKQEVNTAVQEEDAGLRHRSQRHVLSRRHLRATGRRGSDWRRRPRPSRTSDADKPPEAAEAENACMGTSRRRCRSRLLHPDSWPPRSHGGSRCRSAEAVDRPALRVCSTPGNMPFSNQKGEGSRTRSPTLIAGKLGVPVRYTWFPQATGFLRNTLQGAAAAIS